MADKKKYPRKFVNFDPDNKEEMELFKYLERLKFGEFSKETKAYWMEQMRKENKSHARMEGI